MKRVVNTAAEVPGEDEDSYTRSHRFKSIFAEATKGLSSANHFAYWLECVTLG